MNRYINKVMALIAIAISVSIVSCNRQQSDSVQLISFNSQINNYSSQSVLSKGGLITDEASLKSMMEGFSVSASIDIDGQYEPILINRKVSYSSVDNKWSYSPEIYWDRGYNYFFIAYAPRMTQLISEDNPYVSALPQNRYVDFYNIPQYQDVFLQAQQDAALDLMVDSKSGEYNDFNGGKVQFELKHALSMLEIRAVKANKPTMNGRDYKVHSLSIGDVDNKMVLNVNRSYHYNVEDYSLSSWNETTKMSDGKMILVQNSDNQNNILTEGDPDGDVILSRYLIVPFEIGDDASILPIEVQYQYRDKISGEESSLLTIHGAISFKEFKANTKHILTLRFDTGALLEVFPIQVEDWSYGGSYNPSVNNW